MRAPALYRSFLLARPIVTLLPFIAPFVERAGLEEAGGASL